MSKQVVSTTTLPPPVGPFSPAIHYGNLLFVSGQVGVDPATAKLVTGEIEAQTEQALKNLQQVLAAAGKTLDDAVRVGVYLTDMAHFARMNAVYARYFKTPFPARTTIAVAGLPLGALIEIDMWVGM